MQIYGLQKLTLLDYPGKVACTVFTGGCNFCCPFCHNASLVTHIEPAAVMEDEQFFAFLQKRQGVLDGVCVSGGEPLLQKEITAFIEKIKALGYLVKLDSNGSFPQKLKELVNAGLVDYVAMDIKNSPEHYSLTCGVAVSLEDIKTSVEFLKQRKVPYEFRTTVVKELHDEADFISIGQWLQGDSSYYLQNFVDSGDVIAEGKFSAYDKSQLEEFVRSLRATMPNVHLRGI